VVTAVAAPPGPLTTSAELAEEMLLQGTPQAAEWLAYVGLAGRYVPVPNSPHWRRWTGTSWAACDGADVNRTIRGVLGAVYDRRMEARPSATEVMQLLRLMDLNWSLGPLIYELRRITAEALRT
jgi:hypothetical protein